MTNIVSKIILAIFSAKIISAIASAVYEEAKKDCDVRKLY